MGEHLMELSLTTLPEREGETTWYRTLLMNPHPEKVLQQVAIQPLPAFQSAIHLRTMQYL